MLTRDLVFHFTEEHAAPARNDLAAAHIARLLLVFRLWLGRRR